MLANGTVEDSGLPAEDDMCDIIPMEQYFVPTVYVIAQLLIIIVYKFRVRRAQSSDSSTDIGSPWTVLGGPSISTHLLPVYVIILYSLGGAYVAQAFVYTANEYFGRNSLWEIFQAIVWGLEHILLDGFGLQLLAPGVGTKTLKRTTWLILPWGFVTFLCKYLDTYFDHRKIDSPILGIYMAVHGCLYAYFAFSSSSLTRYRRPAFFMYAMCWVVYRVAGCTIQFCHLIMIPTNERAMQDPLASEILACVDLYIRTIPWAVIVPFMTYKSMLDDTRYWLTDDVSVFDEVDGILDDDECNSSIRSPLIGLGLEHGGKQVIGRSMDSFDQKAIISHTELSLNLTQLMGRGGTAKVFRGMRKKRPVAIKLIFLPEISRQTINAFFKEATFLRSLASHPNIVQLIGICVAPPALCHVLELCNGSVHSLIEEQRRLQSRESCWDARPCNNLFLSLGIQCARAVAFLHSREPPIVHRDIKSMNFLFIRQHSDTYHRFSVKLADLDLAQADDGLGRSSNSSTEKYFGTPHWAAPEVLMHESSGSISTDVYSLAVVLWELFTLGSPFQGVERHDLVRRVGQEGLRLTLPVNTPPALRNMFDAAWSADPQDRPSADDMVLRLTELIEDPRTQEREALYNVALLMFDPQRVQLRQVASTEGLDVWCATGKTLFKFLMDAKGAGLNPLLDVQNFNAESLLQTCIDSRVIQLASERRSRKLTFRQSSTGTEQSLGREGEPPRFTKNKLYRLCRGDE
jgi:serine/threonine protein kinase